MEIAEGGVLSESYREYLLKKKSYYHLAVNSIKTQYLDDKIIAKRLTAIQRGLEFGERDIYSLDNYFQYRLIGVLCPNTGEIVVEDLSTKPHKKFITNVMSVYIKGVD